MDFLGLETGTFWQIRFLTLEWNIKNTVFWSFKRNIKKFLMQPLIRNPFKIKKIWNVKRISISFEFLGVKSEIKWTSNFRHIFSKFVKFLFYFKFSIKIQKISKFSLWNSKLFKHQTTLGKIFGSLISRNQKPFF